MKSSHIVTSVDNGILTLTINRQAVKNALSLDMYRQMSLALKQLDADPALSVAIITGGEECFTAGNDLKDFLAGGVLNKDHPTVEFLYQLARTQKPIIAAVAGPAIGIGTTMLLHCDLVYSADNTTFQLPFAQLGLCPEAACSELLPKLAGHAKSFELLVLGDKFNAQTAQDIGLVNKVSSPDSLLSLAIESAVKITNLSSDAVIASKKLLKDSNQTKIENAIAAELKEFQILLNSEHSQKVIGAFFNKR